MNNKRLGTAFERECAELLESEGYWVHFITPNGSGSQPFDIIASKNDKPIVLDCKTSSVQSFSVSRLEENQVLAMELWLRKGNKKAFVFVKYKEKIYRIPYLLLKGAGRVNLKECEHYANISF